MKTRPEKPFCYYATRTGDYDGKPHVVIVTESEPGYMIVNPDTDLGGPWVDMDAARRAADYWNQKLGVSDATRDAIVTSSMRRKPKTRKAKAVRS